MTVEEPLRLAYLHGRWVCGEADGVRVRGQSLGELDIDGWGCADLTPVRDDLWAVLSASPAEAAGLRAAIAEGRIEGSQYQGECACLVGTLAELAGCHHTCIPNLRPNSRRPAERFFLAIHSGDTPKTNQFSRLALQWVDEWLANMRVAFGPKVA